ncbi:MAG: [protein-PII] uridylyltransferase [Polyangiaceae bacterium]|nr:[protein-PII] uridylyltransferase [Polyangiaceae bacterium]
MISKELLAPPRGLPPMGEDPVRWGQRYSAARCARLDEALVELFRQQGPRPGVVLAAVGSYGRGTLSPGSDVDLRLLVPRTGDGTDLAEALLYPLWDARLPVGHQIVTEEELLELAATDLPTATTLLDWRFLAGDMEASEALRQGARRRLEGGALERLIERLDEEVRGRHERFGGSVYLLEPDVKSGEGGLRDLDILGWLQAARHGSSSLEILSRSGQIAPEESTLLHASRELLARLRNMLHLGAGRRQDRLTFEHQEALAPRLGYAGQARRVLGGRDEDEEAVLTVAVEAFMSDYYRHAQVIARVLERQLRRGRPQAPLRELPGSLPPAYELREGQLELATGLDLRQTPAAALGLYQEAVRLGAPVGAGSREQIVQAAYDPHFGAALRADGESARRFLALCVDAAETPQLGRTVMSELREVGLLVAMVPEFAPVVGRVHHDVYHVYTVDVHSVAALDRLKELVRGEQAESYPLACRLAAEELQPEVLHLATLLHDVGKALGGKDHATRGALMSRTIAARLGLDPSQQERVAHLIQHHLAMYHTATKRDLEDPASLEDFMAELPGRDQLRALYLLTVADISTTSPTALTAWKAKLLEDLFRAADARLQGRGQDRQAEEKARKLALDLAGGSEHARAFLDSMPPRYLQATMPGQMARHAQISRKARQEGLACGLWPSPVDGLAELCVVAEDRPGLLAAITAGIVASNLEIQGAQIFSHQPAEGQAQAVDLFWVRCADEGRLPLLERQIHGQLQAYVQRREPVQGALSRRGASPWATRKTPLVPTEVIIDDESSTTASIIEVVTRDRPGVLCALALAFHQLGLSVSLARINTEGTRVADVFYITGEDGSKIDLAPRKSEIKAKIVDILSSLASP